MRRVFPLHVALIATALAVASTVQAQISARAAGYLYLSPQPNAPYVAPDTRFVLIRLQGANPSEVLNLTTSFITVTGQFTGQHRGQTRVASDGRTIVFTMSANFREQELVTVDLNPALATGSTTPLRSYEYQFMITAPMPGFAQSAAVALPRPGLGENEPTQVVRTRLGTATSFKPERKTAVLLTNGVSIPNDFPTVSITANANPSPGCLFLEYGLSAGSPYTMILNNDGLPVWYRRGRMYDFKIQESGDITWCVSDGTGFPAFDQNFNYLRTYQTTNGYLTDGHELKVLQGGAYLMLGYRSNPVDMSRYVFGGSTNTTVRETVVQEFTPGGELIFQWRAWDHYQVAESGVDFPHLNAIAVDDDGHLLVSARHLSEVTKINRDSGEIIWRLGGLNSSFAFPDDPLDGPSFQHNISAPGRGHYLLFDNGNDHLPQISRAIEYEINLSNMTAHVFWQYLPNPEVYTSWLGSAQRLPTGNTLINLVRPDAAKALEVDPRGAKHFELNLLPGSDMYRAFRLPWNGVVAAPYLILEPQPDNVTLIINKFGDTNVLYYRIYGGLSPGPTNLLETSSTPLAHIKDLQDGSRYYFRVTAVDRQGVESQFSNEENIIANLTTPGQNMLLNGDFSAGWNAWDFQVIGDADASATPTADGIVIQIANAGSTTFGIQLVQGGVHLFQGQQYLLQFDAWADQPRYIEAQVAQTDDRFYSYDDSSFFITPVKTHYKLVFDMTSASDPSASVLFNVGASSGNVYLANISLCNLAPGDLNADGKVDLQDLKALADQWLKPAKGASADLNGDGKVNFLDFGILGENWSGASP